MHKLKQDTQILYRFTQRWLLPVLAAVVLLWWWRSTSWYTNWVSLSLNFSSLTTLAKCFPNFVSENFELFICPRCTKETLFKATKRPNSKKEKKNRSFLISAHPGSAMPYPRVAAPKPWVQGVDLRFLGVAALLGWSRGTAVSVRNGQPLLAYVVDQICCFWLFSWFWLHKLQ